MLNCRINYLVTITFYEDKYGLNKNIMFSLFSSNKI